MHTGRQRQSWSVLRGQPLPCHAPGDLHWVRSWWSSHYFKCIIFTALSLRPRSSLQNSTLNKGEQKGLPCRINKTKGQPEVHRDAHFTWSFTHSHVNGPRAFLAQLPCRLHAGVGPSSARKPFMAPPPVVPPVSCLLGTSERDILLSLPQVLCMYSSLASTPSWSCFHLPPVPPHLGNVVSPGRGVSQGKGCFLGKPPLSPLPPRAGPRLPASCPTIS